MKMVQLTTKDGKKTIEVKEEHVERKLAKGWKLKKKTAAAKAAMVINATAS